MKALLLIIGLLASQGLLASHDELIPGSASIRLKDIYGVYDANFSSSNQSSLPQLSTRIRLKKIEGVSGLFWLYANELGKCHGRYKIPMVGEIPWSEKPVIIVYAEGHCFKDAKKLRYSSAIYLPHKKMGYAAEPVKAVLWLGGINGVTVKFKAGAVRKILGL